MSTDFGNGNGTILDLVSKKVPLDANVFCSRFVLVSFG